VDLLTAGAVLGELVPVPELQWHAQAVPYYDYLLRETRQVGVLAGGHCVPVNAPAPERLVWHKLYSSARRASDRIKAEKDLRQAATLAAILVEVDDVSLEQTASRIPSEVMAAAQSRSASLKALLRAHPQALEQMDKALTQSRRR
jgi:hypothetical protein